MKPWQILFCLVCVLGVPALVKFEESRNTPVESSPTIPGEDAGDEPGPAMPSDISKTRVESDATPPPKSPGQHLSYALAQSALTAAGEALKAGRDEEVARNLRLALAAAEELSFASPERVGTLIQTGVMFRAAQPEVGAALLHQAAAELDLLPARVPSDQNAAGPLPLILVHSLYSTLGDHYRLQGSAEEAEQWLRRAVQTSGPVAGIPLDDPELRGRLIAEDLFLLAQAHCAAGDPDRSRPVLEEMHSWCAKLADQDAASGCRVPNKELPCWSRP